MRIRHIIAENKEIQSDTGWMEGVITPRYAPVFDAKRQNKPGWQWRSAKVKGETNDFVLFITCKPSRDKWQAVLIKVLDTSHASVVCRYEHHGEYHGKRPGLHVHADCDKGGIETGAESMDILLRIPQAGVYHRRPGPFTEVSFWEEAQRFFRIKQQKGELT